MASPNYRFKLFISGMSVRSTRAVDNLKQVCDEHLQGQYELEIIDVSRDRQMAVTYQIFALPTLLKLLPEPERIVVGDLSDKQKVLKILDLA